MTDNTAHRKAGIVLAAATVSMGLIAGLYYGWAVSVMPGLAGLDDRAFVSASQEFDAAIQNPFFFASFLGAIVLTGAAAQQQRRLGLRQATPWILAALILYSLGFLTTMAISVPLSSDIADAGDPNRIADLAGVRDAFEDKFVAWNIVRTVLSTAALGCLAYALLLHGRAERAPARQGAAAPAR
jgi:uncharacterized membrane protein